MRSRKALKPDTFPFLAVLLCAMGSLILLLLVIDRQAKIVARTKALQAASHISEEQQKLAAARQAEELEQLEQALLALKELRRRERQTYSLVPYKGRRGDNRRPLYLECTSSSLIFHPDRLTLSSPSQARAEVEGRIARQRQES